MQTPYVLPAEENVRIKLPDNIDLLSVALAAHTPDNF